MTHPAASAKASIPTADTPCAQNRCAASDWISFAVHGTLFLLTLIALVLVINRRRLKLDNDMPIVM
jgi:hypothetical protein